MTDQPGGDPGTPGAARHYSYAHYASRDVAEGFDALRFGGPIGRYLLEAQQHLLLEAVDPPAGRAILDVGTGTGRAALALAAAGASVTGVDASREMLDVARARATESGLSAQFEVADAHALPFADRSVDVAICLRLLMHVPDWRLCVGELCRVARWRVIVDFPARASFAALESAARRRAAASGRVAEPYRVLAEREVRERLEAGGFHLLAVHRQFVLPIALHKKVGSRALTTAVEGGLGALGLRRLFGSPVTMVAER
jgi:ubiquinone/menaquinone biosynthesis C-methylase UbiE